LPPEAQRFPLQQPQFGQRIKYHAPRLYLFHPPQNAFDRIGKFHLARVENRILLLRLEALRHGQQLVNVDPFEAPPVRLRYLPEFPLRFGQRYVQNRLPLCNSFQ